MKNQLGSHTAALLLTACLALLLNGCLGGGGSDGNGGAAGPTTTAVTTDANGEATFNNTTYTLVDELGVTQPGIELTIDTKTGMAEVVSPDYTYNAVPASNNGKTVVFTQKVDSAKFDWQDDDLDAECPAFTEDIGTQNIELPPTQGQGLAKPTPKTLASSDGKASAVIAKMTLTKDITAAITPYKALNYIPMTDQIATQIGSTQVTVLAGADVNIVDSLGKPTTAEAACFTGTLTFKASNELATPAEIQEAIAGNEVVLIIFKDKQWHKVNASITYDEATATITIQNAPASLRLYPFLFVQAPAVTTFTVTGTVHESVETQQSQSSYPTIAGATVSASLPQVLQALVVDNTAGTITIGGPDTYNYQYDWSLFPISNGVVDYSADLLANVTSASGNVISGSTTFTVDDQVKALMPTDGQYLIAVATSHQKQTGIITKNGTTYTIQMNPLAADALTTTSGADGTYTLPGLVVADQQFYTLEPSKSGYQGFTSNLYGTISNGTISNFDLWMHKVAVTTTTTSTTTTGTMSTTTTTMGSGLNNGLLTGNFAFVSAGNSSGAVEEWWTSYGTMTFNGTGGWNESFTANFNQGSPFTGTLPTSGSGFELYEVYNQTHLSLWGSDITAVAIGGVNAAGSTGVAAFTSTTQREPLFFTKMGSGYNYSTNLMGTNWFFVSYNPVGTTPYSWHDRITFDSTGFTSPSQNQVPASGTTTLTSAGTFTLPALDATGTPFASPLDCSLNANHDLALCGQIQTAGQPVTVAGVKLGATNSYTLASIAGTFHVAGAVKSSVGTQSRQGSIVVDGNGNWNGTFIVNDSGSYAANGTYTYDGPANPGRYTLTETSPGSAVLYCGVSADMATTVCHIASDPSGAVGFYFGVKAPALVP